MTPSTQHRSIGYRLLLLLLLLLPVPYAHALDAKPHIVVNFNIEAPTFQRNLPERGAAQDAIGRQLAALIAQRFAFADWTVTAGDAESRLGALVLKLEEDDSTVPNPRIVVRWYGAAGPAVVAGKQLPIPAVEIYAPTNPNWDTNSRRNFQTRVLGKLVDIMRADAFYDQLFSVFVSKLPIAEQVKAVANDRAIDVPVAWRELLLAPESVVVVRFRINSGTAVETGTLKLNPIAPRLVVLDPATNTTSTLLRGAVDEATVGVHRLHLVGNWNDELPNLLNGADVTCYLVKYKPLEFGAVDAGLVLNLEP